MKFFTATCWTQTTWGGDLSRVQRSMYCKNTGLYLGSSKYWYVPGFFKILVCTWVPQNTGMYLGSSKYWFVPGFFKYWFVHGFLKILVCTWVHKILVCTWVLQNTVEEHCADREVVPSPRYIPRYPKRYSILHVTF